MDISAEEDIESDDYTPFTSQSFYTIQEGSIELNSFCLGLQRKETGRGVVDSMRDSLLVFSFPCLALR